MGRPEQSPLCAPRLYMGKPNNNFVSPGNDSQDGIAELNNAELGQFPKQSQRSY